MGIDTAIYQSETDPTAWIGVKGDGAQSTERFPWEYGSARETWRGRIGALLFGAVLALLVFLSNEETITALKNDTLKLTSASVQRSARTTVSSAPAVRHDPKPEQAPTHIPPVSQPMRSTPPRVQLGSYSSKAQAVAASDRMRQNHATIFARRQLIVVEAVVGRTLFYRVVIDLQSERAALDLCEAIKQERMDCLVWHSTAVENPENNQ